jgi:hypothetical protein
MAGFTRKKTKIKFEGHFEKQNAHHSDHSIFWNAQHIAGRKVCFVRSSPITLENWVQVFYAVMLPNRTGAWLSSPKCNMIRVIDVNWASHIYMCMMLMSSYHKAPEMWLKLQVKISGDCILTCVIDNLKEMGRPRVLQIWDALY